MKVNYFFYNFTKSFFAILFSIIILNLNTSEVLALQMIKTDETIVEELRLNVPSQYMETWIKAEKEIWDPWLAKQDGFLSRKIFYNKDKEEALLLVNWKNKELWKSISSEEVNKIQNIFESNIKNSLSIDNYPFQLIYEGELLEKK